MHLSDCEHPLRIYNKYLGEYVWTSCGKCNTCKRKRANRWISRLELERSKHLMSFFVTLTYDNEHLPKYVPDGFGNLFSHDGCILFDELQFDTVADRGFYDGLCRLGGIPYASVCDIQKFHKRLNKYFYEKVTKTYKNFRYFLVSEYGSTGQRPHYHAIYFIDSPTLVEQFSKGVFSCWSDNKGLSLGRCDVQCIERSACSYVAAYLNKLFDLPSFYQHKSLRPFFLCSKRPSIGSFSECAEDDKEIFLNAQPIQMVHRAQDVQLTAISLPKCYQNRLFPKLIFDSKIPDSLRTSLYRCSERFGENCQNFKQWLDLFVSEYRHYKNFSSPSFNTVIEYLSCLAEGLTAKGIERLRRLYYISKRVCKQACMFGVSLRHYVEKIDLFYQRKELLLLKQFYKFQDDYSRTYNVEDLVFCYPEYSNINVKSNYISKIEDCQDYRIMCADNAQLFEKSTKSHFKNDYFQSQIDSGNLIYQMIQIYKLSKLCLKT